MGLILQSYDSKNNKNHEKSINGVRSLDSQTEEKCFENEDDKYNGVILNESNHEDSEVYQSNGTKLYQDNGEVADPPPEMYALYIAS